jgi:hypothetical protein
MSNETVAETLCRFFKRSTYPILFAGAGVSGRAGLPTWKCLMEKLAEGLRSLDPMTTQQMLNCINDGDYTLAFDYFQLTRKMVEGDKQNLLVRLLSDFDARAIQSLLALPFRGCVTTNFDRSIFDALAAGKGESARDYRFGDQSFKQAQWEEKYFVARIHGAVEMPDSIILSEKQFEELLRNSLYADFLGKVFLHRNMLFLGFSFYDPAIRHVFSELNKQFGAAAPGRHMALIPSGTSSDFLLRANRLNIEVVQYDPADNHAALWDGIQQFGVQQRAPTVLAAPKKAVPFESTKRFLAACYARAKTAGASQALRTAVLEGIISAILQESAPQAMSRRDIQEKIRVAVGLHGKTADFAIEEAIKSLSEAGFCRKLKATGADGIKFVWIGSIAPNDSLEYAIGVLTKNLRNRAYLQEGWSVSSETEISIARFFDHLIRRRGWDLGAAFAAGKAPESLAIESLLRECTHNLPEFDQQRLVRVCQGMFQHPSQEEAGVLGELGRVSFAVELAFQSPRSILLHKAILPRKIYFDANVLLPMLVDGHPLSTVYLEAVTRLRSAAASAAVPLNLSVCMVYLNEIISHRANALEYSEQVGDNFPDIARSDALYHGLTNVNVYVGGFANWISNNAQISFREFLKRFAPYETEAQLKRWLAERSFNVVESTKGPSYASMYSLLEKAYAESLSRGKGPILIEHDAIQLSILNADGQRAESALFVTADRRLQQVAAESKYSAIADMMMSHVGLVQFIELLLGGITDGAALTELLWSARVSNQAQAVRSYFTTRGLEQYDDGMAMAMPQMVERFAEIANSELHRIGADLEAEDPKTRATAFRTLGSLEKDYLSGMSAAAEKLRKQLSEID